MRITWVQDRTGRNVIHCAGCSHTRLDIEAAEFDVESLDAAMIAIAQDNIDPEIATLDEASEWVSVARCAR